MCRSVFFCDSLNWLKHCRLRLRQKTVGGEICKHVLSMCCFSMYQIYHCDKLHRCTCSTCTVKPAVFVCHSSWWCTQNRGIKEHKYWLLLIISTRILHWRWHNIVSGPSLRHCKHWSKQWCDVSYRLSIVTIALSVTIRPQFAIKCLRRSNQQGVGHFGPKFMGVPLGVDLWYLGPQRASIPG